MSQGCRVTFKIFKDIKTLFFKEKKKFKYVTLVIKDEFWRYKITDYIKTFKH